MPMQVWLIGGALVIIGLLLVTLVLLLGKPKRARPANGFAQARGKGWPIHSVAETASRDAAQSLLASRIGERKFRCDKLNGPLPPLLVDFHLIREWDLSRAHRYSIVALARQIPRPPSLLPELLKDGNVDHYSPRDFANRVKRDSIITARILSTVNSPFYGLKDPIESVDHAVVYLGYNMVKTIALRVALEQSFKTQDAKVREVYHQLWQSCTIAGELAFRLAQRLEQPRADLIATNAVLSFLSQFAVISLNPRWANYYNRAFDLFSLTRAEQHELNANSALLGFLLAREWGLPENNLAAIAHSLDVMVTPVDYAEPATRVEQTLIFGCARIAELVVFQGLTTFADLDFCAMSSPTFHYLAGYLELPELNGFYPALRDDRILKSLPAMR